MLVRAYGAQVTSTLDRMTHSRSVALAIGLACVSTGVVACERNEHGVFEDISCAAAALSEADRELNSAYRELTEKLAPEQMKLLVRSQRAWLAFLKEEAAFIYSVEGDGSGGRLVVANFREAQTRMRAEDLRSWSSN
jgi:uncharacterized protein YecT (DUF1311 family)